MNKYFTYIVYLVVFTWFSFARAGVYEDFFRAIHGNDAKSAAYLVEVRGVDPNWPNDKGMPALVLALYLESDAVAHYLAKAPGLKPELTNEAGETGLMIAAIRNRMDVAEALIERGAEVNRPGWSPLHYAATRGHVGMMRLLLENSAYIDAEAPNGNTPLMMAVQFASPAAVKLLLEEGADPNIKNHQGLTALDLAQRNSNPMVAQYVQIFLEAWYVNDLRDRGELN